MVTASMALFEATVPSSSLRPLSRALAGLSKIGDEVSFEAFSSKVMLSTMNLSKSAFGMITLESSKFFTSFNCPNPMHSRDVLVRCKLQIRLLLGIFKARNMESREHKDSGIESCEIKITDNSHSGACRFTIRLLCKHGVVKTHQLTYSASSTLYAKFDREECTQHFIIQSRTAKEYLDYFQSRIEEVDIYTDEEETKLIWNGYTEGFVGDDMRTARAYKTQVSLSTKELDDFQFEEGVHIHIPLRDFKASVSLAENLGVPIHVMYSKPGKPCIVSFAREDLGVVCEFVIAAATELNSTQSSSLDTRLTNNARSRQTSARATEEPMMVDNQDGVGWGSETAISPARTSRTREEHEEDLYGEQIHLEEEEEEVPPTQQERYQGIFDM